MCSDRAIQICTPGRYCVEGASAPIPCPEGTYSSAVGSADVSACASCPAGYACPTGSTAPTVCAAGTISAAGMALCDKCAAGKYQSAEAQISCKQCPPGSVCARGASTPVPCPGGTYGYKTGMQAMSECHKVTTGYWAPQGSKAPESCFDGFYCPGAADDDVNEVAGSKPIILESGTATETITETKIVEEARFEVSTNMTLDADLSTFNATAFRIELAVLYGVPLEYIQLAVSAGSIALSITIGAPAAAAGAAAVTGGQELNSTSVLNKITSVSNQELSAVAGANVIVSALPVMHEHTVRTEMNVTKINKITCPAQRLTQCQTSSCMLMDLGIVCVAQVQKASGAAQACRRHVRGTLITNTSTQR